jgi:hypothetical protein
VNETEPILDADSDQPMQQDSSLREDEDPDEEVVNDQNVLTEVILPSTVRKFNSFITFPCC